MNACRFTLAVFVGIFLLTFSSSGAAQDSSATPTPSPAPMTTLPASVLNAELQSADGGSFRLSDYSGQVLVINLWATWCGPCRLETPKLVKLQEEFRAQGVVVVGLTAEVPEDSAGEVRTWVRDFAIPYRIGWTGADVVIALMNGRDAIPQTFVVSPTGQLVKRFIGFNPAITPSQWKDAVKEALEESDNQPAVTSSHRVRND